MASEPLTIRVDPGSELGRALAETNGRRYRVSPDEEAPADDPEKLREALDRHAGSRSDLDREAPKAYIDAGREAGTRPPDRA